MAVLAFLLMGCQSKSEMKQLTLNEQAVVVKSLYQSDSSTTNLYEFHTDVAYDHIQIEFQEWIQGNWTTVQSFALTANEQADMLAIGYSLHGYEYYYAYLGKGENGVYDHAVSKDALSDEAGMTGFTLPGPYEIEANKAIPLMGWDIRSKANGKPSVESDLYENPEKYHKKETIKLMSVSVTFVTDGKNE